VAFVYCTKCGHHPVATSAPRCPRCGAPRSQTYEPSTATEPRPLAALKSQTALFFANESEVQGYAKVCGVLALALAIAGFLVPVVGVLLITPIAIGFNLAALFGGYRGVPIATTVLVLVNLIVSPTFWLNVATGAIVPNALLNQLLSYLDLAGVIGMFCLIAWPRRRQF